LLFVITLVSISGKPISSTNRLYLNKKTRETIYYIDIKSKLLRGLLRDVLKDIAGINLNDQKLFISYIVYYIN
jgi:hypothetical protein